MCINGNLKAINFTLMAKGVNKHIFLKMYLSSFWDFYLKLMKCPSTPFLPPYVFPGSYGTFWSSLYLLMVLWIYPCVALAANYLTVANSNLIPAVFKTYVWKKTTVKKARVLIQLNSQNSSDVSFCDQRIYLMSSKYVFHESPRFSFGSFAFYFPCY